MLVYSKYERNQKQNVKEKDKISLNFTCRTENLMAKLLEHLFLYIWRVLPFTAVYQLLIKINFQSTKIKTVIVDSDKSN